MWLHVVITSASRQPTLAGKLIIWGSTVITVWLDHVLKIPLAVSAPNAHTVPDITAFNQCLPPNNCWLTLGPASEIACFVALIINTLQGTVTNEIQHGLASLNWVMSFLQATKSETVSHNIVTALSVTDCLYRKTSEECTPSYYNYRSFRGRPRGRRGHF